MIGAEVGERGALPGDGADEGDEVSRRKAAAFPLEEAGAEGMAATLGKVEEGRCESLRLGVRGVDEILGLCSRQATC